MNQENIDEIKNLSILYVEDDIEIQNTFGDLLKKFFSNIQVCSNGAEGLEAFQKLNSSYDFIISDIEMPEMTGLEMIERIKKIDSNIPCILTTAHGEFDYFMKANEIGVFRYIQKPIDIDELLEAIRDSQNGLEVKKIDL